MTRPFEVDLGWKTILTNSDIRPAAVLRRAALPEDLFSRVRPLLPAPDFFRLWQGVMQFVGDDAPGLILANAVSSETFNPPLLATYCSPNLTSAVERLSIYKPLIGPLRLQIHDTLGGLEITYEADDDLKLPTEFIIAELAVLVNVARIGTGTSMRPIAVEVVHPSTSDAYKAFFGRPVRKGPFNRVVFAREDAKVPFLSPNPALFAFFDPDLRVRLDELERDATMTDRVRAVLMESLPSGLGDTETVAKRLGVSSRGLQRKLAAEQTRFQSELSALRTRLSKKYLCDTDLNSAQVAFLLGYEDPNSFIRAFHTWTGTTPEAHRRAARLSQFDNH